VRRQRRDIAWRRWASRAVNWLRERTTDIHMTDQGSMFRGYHRAIVQAVVQSRESQTFIPALAYLYSGNPIEIEVGHEQRAAGRSKYSLFKLIHLNFDLMTSFSTAPLQLFSMLGMGLALGSLVFVVYLALRRLIIGPEVQGVFTLFAIVFFLIGIMLFGIGLLGEYVGRIASQVRQRSQFLVRAVLEAPPGDEGSRP
jgi:undecaprenyl-phosphate 4-deoxy-4-formamido-L-arabinose transferase